MVPGEFSTVMPCLAANPERGRTCPSKPAGISMNNPVGMSALSSGARVMASGKNARRSIPAASAVPYVGSEWVDWLITLIFMRFSGLSTRRRYSFFMYLNHPDESDKHQTNQQFQYPRKPSFIQRKLRKSPNQQRHTNRITNAPF